MMVLYLSADIASEHRRDLLADAAAYRRSRAVRRLKAPNSGRRHGRVHRGSAFVKDLAAASP